MPHDRFFLETSFSLEQTVLLEKEEFHHLAHVMRLRQGEQVDLINGRNELAHAQIEALFPSSALLKISSVEKGKAKKRVILAQALLRLTRLEWLIEKAVELDVTEFWLFAAQLSEKDSLSPTQLVRLKNLIISAMKQCGRLDLPTLVFYPSLSKLPSEGSSFFGDLRSDAPHLLDYWNQTPHPLEPLVLLIGPEKGFTVKEIDLLTARGAQGVCLHTNTLRAETAAIVGLSMIVNF